MPWETSLAIWQIYVSFQCTNQIYWKLSFRSLIIERGRASPADRHPWLQACKEGTSADSHNTQTIHPKTFSTISCMYTISTQACKQVLIGIIHKPSIPKPALQYQKFLAKSYTQSVPKHANKCWLAYANVHLLHHMKPFKTFCTKPDIAIIPKLASKYHSHKRMVQSCPTPQYAVHFSCTTNRSGEQCSRDDGIHKRSPPPQ